MKRFSEIQNMLKGTSINESETTYTALENSLKKAFTTGAQKDFRAAGKNLKAFLNSGSQDILEKDDIAACNNLLRFLLEIKNFDELYGFDENE
jgi:hypothetical protein